MADRLRQDESRTAAEAEAQRQAAEARERQARELALARIEESRETRLAVAVLLLVLSLLAFGGGGIAMVKDRHKPAIVLGGGGALLLVAAVIVFFTRPSREDVTAESAGNGSAAAEAEPTRFAGRNLCTLVPDRSRVTVSSSESVPLEWSATGCVNGRTQYARNGDIWTRVLVPEAEQAVTVAEFRPSSGEYVVTRYQLNAEAMGRVRALRRDVDIKACTADEESRTVLADQLREIGDVLPELPNERLVYRCENQGPGSESGTVAAGSIGDLVHPPLPDRRGCPIGSIFLACP
jgi:hypothetical protein